MSMVMIRGGKKLAEAKLVGVTVGVKGCSGNGGGIRGVRSSDRRSLMGVNRVRGTRGDRLGDGECHPGDVDRREYRL